MKKLFAILTLISMITGTSAQAATFTAEGTLAGVSTFTTRVFNTPDGSDNGGGVLGFNAGAGATYVSSLQAIEIDFNDNNVGNQAINIHTSNPGDVEGMIGVTDPNYHVPMMWVVTADPLVGGQNNYTFSGDTAAEAFIIDDNHVDVGTYGNIAFNIDNQTASLSNFPSDNGAGDFRQDTNGEIWVYFGTNYTGAPAQEYETTNLVIELQTQP
jgi:hypothetical protein